MTAPTTRSRRSLRIRLAAGVAALAGVVSCLAATPAHAGGVSTHSPGDPKRSPVCGFCWHV